MKILLVNSEWDYGALSFEQEFAGEPVAKFIKRVENGEEIVAGDVPLECEVHEFGPIDERFIALLRSVGLIDYDAAKHQNVYFDTDLV